MDEKTDLLSSFKSKEAREADFKYWWFEFMKRQGKHQASMGPPNRDQLAKLSNLEAKHGRAVLNGAVYLFLRRPDDFGGVRNMWDFFISQSFLWIPLGSEEALYREQNDGMPSLYDEDSDYE